MLSFRNRYKKLPSKIPDAVATALFRIPRKNRYRIFRPLKQVNNIYTESSQYGFFDYICFRCVSYIATKEIMKKNIFLSFILFIPLFAYSGNGNSGHLPELQRLMHANVLYDSIVPADSVISWGERLSPVLEREKRAELFFRIRQWMVSLYSFRGDIGRAVDEARQMYEKAEAGNDKLGIALSCIAIGDAYYCSNMLQEAADSYKEAVYHPAISATNEHDKEKSLLRLIFTLIRLGNMQEAEIYRNELSRSEVIHTDKVLQFFTCTTDALYALQNGELHEARRNLSKAEELYRSDRQPAYLPALRYVKGRCSEATGEHTLALRYYDDILGNIPRKMRSVIYLQVAYSKAGLLVKMNRMGEAARLYEEINRVTDSVVAPSYAHRINSLRTSYRENRIKVENKAAFNRIFTSGILIGILLLAGIFYLSLHIRKQNEKIAASKKLLEQSRLQAENALKTKSLLLSNMSHEIRTPLSALSGFSSLLSEPALDPETRRQCGEIIQQNSDLLLKLIDDVIDLSNFEIGNMKFNFGLHDAVVICRNVIDTIDKVKQTQAALRFTTSLESLEIYTDESRLQQLLINLLINATKFTSRGSITLGVERQAENTALFSVTDTGCGIPLEKQSKIFGRFEKLNENAQGTGLGLSICQLIVERIGGRIWIDSTYTDGCRFCFTHPLHPEEKGKERQL